MRRAANSRRSPLMRRRVSRALVIIELLAQTSTSASPLAGENTLIGVCRAAHTSQVRATRRRRALFILCAAARRPNFRRHEDAIVNALRVLANQRRARRCALSMRLRHPRAHLRQTGCIRERRNQFVALRRARRSRPFVARSDRDRRRLDGRAARLGPTTASRVGVRADARRTGERGDRRPLATRPPPTRDAPAACLQRGSSLLERLGLSKRTHFRRHPRLCASRAFCAHQRVVGAGVLRSKHSLFCRRQRYSRLIYFGN